MSTKLEPPGKWKKCKGPDEGEMEGVGGREQLIFVKYLQSRIFSVNYGNLI